MHSKSAHKKTKILTIKSLFFEMSLFLFQIIYLISSNDSTDTHLYDKQYPNIGRVGYYCEYLGNVDRHIPEVKTQNFVTIDHIPIYGGYVEKEFSQKMLLLSESSQIVTTQHSGSYDSLDKFGRLYLNGELVPQICTEFNLPECQNSTFRSLYKHYGSYNLYGGNVSDSEPAIIKRITIHPRNFGYHLTGLYAPPGELITVRISEEDLEAVGTLYLTIGQVLNNKQANNIWETREFVRMPVICNTFALRKALNPHERDGNDYIFYVGSFLGGPIYVNPASKPYLFTITISGAVKYAHFIKGYTTKEEFDLNFGSTAPYFDLEVWQHGIWHSGPKKQVEVSSYDEFYEAATYWEKVSGVSHQIPTSNDISCTVNMMYEVFIAAGSAVAFPARGTTNCPEIWFTYVLDYQKYIIKASADLWGPHHEFNHHYQSGWGLSDDGEVSNNANTLVAYSFYTRISERRTEDHEPDGDGWNRYTSASFAVKDATSKTHDYQLVFHATLLHCLGQFIFIKAAQKKYGASTNNWHRAYTELTELDFTYFFKDVYNISSFNEETAFYKDTGYKSFVPIACRYQTGIGYMIKGKRNVVHTMRPFVIYGGQPKLLNFTKQIFVPNDIVFKIKSITQPAHGTLVKQSENIYLYTPETNEVYSGEFNVTISLTKIDDPTFVIDDVEIYIELMQSYELRELFTTPQLNGKRKLDTKIYVYPEGQLPLDPVAAFQSDYAGSETFVDILSNNTIGNCNTDIWFTDDSQYLPNRISEIRGKFEVQAGSYSIALRGRHHCALFLSFDNGQTYELAANVSGYTDASFHHDNPNTYHNYTFTAPQWVYFKGVLIHSISEGRLPYIGLGLGQIQSNGQCSISYLNAYEESYRLDNLEFSVEDVFPRVWTESISKKYTNRGSLLQYQYTAYVGESDPYSIEHLFDEDDSNEIHTKANTVSESTPFSVLVDLGKTIFANHMTIYHHPEYHHYYAKTFTLYVGNSLHDMHLLLNVTESVVIDNRIDISFESESFRYYQYNVTATYWASNYLCYRYLEFTYNFNGELVSLDDKRVSLYNSWEKKNAISAFGMIYIGQKDSRVEFKFNGTKIGIKSLVSNEYGQFRILLDGVKIKVVNLSNPLNQVAVVYSDPQLEDKEHSLIIEGIDKFNIDSLIYGPDLTTTDESLTDPFLDFQGNEPLPTSVTPIPSVGGLMIDDSGYFVYSSKLELIIDGIIDGIIKYPIEDHKADIVLIKVESTLVVDLIVPSGQESIKNKYLDIQKENAILTIIPKDGQNYGANEIGFHPNSKSPTIQLSTKKVPLNIYNKENNSVNVISSNSETQIELSNLYRASGNLKMNANPGIQSIAINEINSFNEGAIESVSGNKSIQTVASKLNLYEDSTTAVSNFKIIDILFALPGSTLIAKESITFHSESTLNLSISSFIDLDYATIDGIPRSLHFTSSTRNSLQSSENSLICGFHFECDKWLSIYQPSDADPDLKCSQNSKNQICLCINDDNDVNQNGNKKSSQTMLIIIIAAAAAVVIIIFVIIIVVVLKKRANKFGDFDSEDERETVTNAAAEIF